MNTIDDTLSARDLTNFQSGVNLGYSLGSWNGDSKLLKSINTIIKRNPHSSFCRGINNGVEKAILDQDKTRTAGFEDRMSELGKNRNPDKDSKEIEL